jgi:glycosyltransferase involved in cell wall biosynthesis
VQESGHSLHTDFTFLADSDLANLIYATDFLVCPFRHISNSGFINLALAAGTPLILPDWASLDWVPRNCAIWYPAQGGPEALALAIQSASALDPSERESMSQSGKAFMASRSWDNYVLKHITLYRSL